MRHYRNRQFHLKVTYTRTGDDGNTNTQEVSASALQNYQTEITSLSSGYSYEIKVTAFISTAESVARFITVTTGTSSIGHRHSRLSSFGTSNFLKKIGVLERGYFYLLSSQP